MDSHDSQAINLSNKLYLKNFFLEWNLFESEHKHIQDFYESLFPPQNKKL